MMNEQTKGRIRIFGVLLLSVVAVHLVVLRLVIPAGEAPQKEKQEKQDKQEKTQKLAQGENTSISCL